MLAALANTSEKLDGADQIAEKLCAKGWLPQLIMCSSAVRTVETLDTMKDAVSAFGLAETHARGSLFTVAAMDGMTLQHLQVLGRSDARPWPLCHWSVDSVQWAVPGLCRI